MCLRMRGRKEGVWRVVCVTGAVMPVMSRDVVRLPTTSEASAGGDVYHRMKSFG